MTTEELDCIDRALSALVVDDACPAGAKSAALRFNARLQRERSRLLDGARAAQGEARALSPELEIELRGAAIMFAAERERVVQLWRLLRRSRD